MNDTEHDGLEALTDEELIAKVAERYPEYDSAKIAEAVATRREEVIADLRSEPSIETVEVQPEPQPEPEPEATTVVDNKAPYGWDVVGTDGRRIVRGVAESAARQFANELKSQTGERLKVKPSTAPNLGPAPDEHQ